MLTLLLLVVAVLLAAGCAENKVSLIPVTSPGPVTITSSFPRDLPSGYWIKIDPIVDKDVGDVVAISSMTNLSIDTVVEVRIITAAWHPKRRDNITEVPVIGCSGPANVTPGMNGINYTSFIIQDTSYFKPGAYLVIVSDAKENVWENTTFNFT
jgi:hypothetical protein